jgi:tryptophan-rich sensory protein
MSLLFLTFLAASAAAAATGTIFKPGAWYDGLQKPSWNPPKWAFPVVWTTLYLLSAIAATRVALQPDSGQALAFWALQIALNTLWTPVVFGGHRLGAGVVVILALWLSLVAVMVSFFGHDLWAGLMIVPYLVWVSLATALNIWLWRNNPAA